MICEKTRNALEKLFLSEEQIAQEENQEEGTEQETDKKIAEKKDQPRTNGVIITDYKTCGYHLDVQLSPEQLVDAVKIIDQNDFFIESITGVDWIAENQLEVIYDFSRYDFDLCRVVIRTRTDRNNASIPSITAIYNGANWHERETAEFFGIDFTGHPHLVPLLLPEDADYHPLRKDFTV